METAIRFIQDGGDFMYPILIVLFVGLAVVFERIIYLQMAKVKNKKTWDTIFPMISKGQFKQALDEVKDSETGIARVISYGLERGRLSRRHDDVELAMEEGFLAVKVPKVQVTPGTEPAAIPGIILGQGTNGPFPPGLM